MGSVPQTFTQPPTNKRGKYLCVTGPKQLPVCDYVAKNKACKGTVLQLQLYGALHVCWVSVYTLYLCTMLGSSCGLPKTDKHLEQPAGKHVTGIWGWNVWAETFEFYILLFGSLISSPFALHLLCLKMFSFQTVRCQTSIVRRIQRSRMYKSIADSLRKLLDYNRTTIGHCSNFWWAVLQQHQEHLHADPTDSLEATMAGFIQ